MGYTHCFYLTGGHIMHLSHSASRYFECIPFVHEVSAGIAAEYFNATEKSGKAFCLVTSGPGLTNVMTAIAGAFLESRELLVIGGQVKTSDLANGLLRQRGIQEIDGVAIAEPITKKAVRLTAPINFKKFSEYVALSASPRKGPVFLEMPIDVQGMQVDERFLSTICSYEIKQPPMCNRAEINDIAEDIRGAKRPVILLGGGINRAMSGQLEILFKGQDVAVMTTWNAADRISSNHDGYFGRPNTWGMRYSNVLLQQADLLVAVGSRLSLQQTGFNWQKFLPKGKVIQVDCDQAELDKGHPEVYKKLCVDANSFILELLKKNLGVHREWIEFCREVKRILPVNEKCNITKEGYSSPSDFYTRLSEICNHEDIIITCSSGGAFTTAMQAFFQKKGQIIINNKGLASMGYGLAGAIGASLASKPQRTILIEGDGGFSQNLQELGTVEINKLNMKIFIFNDSGYASIRMTQKNYFNGKYAGCDVNTGLGFPRWEKLFAAYNIPSFVVDDKSVESQEFLDKFNKVGCQAFIVSIDPEQTYFPKINSRVTPTGMESSPLHEMHPELPDDIKTKVFKYLA